MHTCSFLSELLCAGEDHQNSALQEGAERRRTSGASSALPLTVNCICRTAARFCYAGRCPRPWPPEGQMGFT